MCSAGANLVPPELKVGMHTEIECLNKLMQSCVNASQDIPLPEGVAELPHRAVLKKRLDLVKKRCACLMLSIKSYVLQAQSDLNR